MSGPILLALRLALALCLYAFLGWTLYTLWQDLKQHGRQVFTYRQPPLTLYLLNGESKSFRFELPDVLVGRDPACDCVLNDSTVSARHVRLYYRLGQWWAEDLRSTNGTALNGEEIHEPAALADGDRLRCGQVNLRIALDEV